MDNSITTVCNNQSVSSPSNSSTLCGNGGGGGTTGIKINLFSKKKNNPLSRTIKTTTTSHPSQTTAVAVVSRSSNTPVTSSSSLTLWEDSFVPLQSQIIDGTVTAGTAQYETNDQGPLVIPCTAGRFEKLQQKQQQQQQQKCRSTTMSTAQSAEKVNASPVPGQGLEPKSVDVKNEPSSCTENPVSANTKVDNREDTTVNQHSVTQNNPETTVPYEEYNDNNQAFKREEVDDVAAVNAILQQHGEHFEDNQLKDSYDNSNSRQFGKELLLSIQPAVGENRDGGGSNTVGESESGDDEQFRRELSALPDAAPVTSEVYKRIPVEQFGAAMLRGMGWKDPLDGTSNGNSHKRTGQQNDYVPQQPRPHRLGLGAISLAGASLPKIKSTTKVKEGKGQQNIKALVEEVERNMANNDSDDPEHVLLVTRQQLQQRQTKMQNGSVVFIRLRLDSERHNQQRQLLLHNKLRLYVGRESNDCTTSNSPEPEKNHSINDINNINDTNNVNNTNNINDIKPSLQVRARILQLVGAGPGLNMVQIQYEKEHEGKTDSLDADTAAAAASVTLIPRHDIIGLVPMDQLLLDPFRDYQYIPVTEAAATKSSGTNGSNEEDIDSNNKERSKSHRYEDDYYSNTEPFHRRQKRQDRNKSDTHRDNSHYNASRDIENDDHEPQDHYHSNRYKEKNKSVRLDRHITDQQRLIKHDDIEYRQRDGDGNNKEKTRKVCYKSDDDSDDDDHHRRKFYQKKKHEKDKIRDKKRKKKSRRHYESSDDSTEQEKHKRRKHYDDSDRKRFKKQKKYGEQNTGS